MKSKRLISVLLIQVAFMGCFIGLSRADAVSRALRKMEGGTFYLACNLHADPIHKNVSSVNYQLRGELLPWGTKVEIVRFFPDKMLFKDLGTETMYSYVFHAKTTRVTSIEKHLERYFTADIESLKTKVKGLSEKDQEGIYAGKVLFNMTREGVLIAIGYPPEFATPALERAREWQYWRARHAKFIVAFDKEGKVREISGNY